MTNKIDTLSKKELSILTCISNKAFKNAKQISFILEIDISYVHKLINNLINKKMIGKTNSKPYEYYSNINLKNDTRK